MDGAASTIGTPDDLVKMIKSVYDKSGGFGTVVGFVHDWANPENTMRSWDMVARYVIPEINGYVAKLRESQKFLIDNRAVFDRAGQAIMAKIMENKDAAEALKVTELAALRRGIGISPQDAGQASGGVTALGRHPRRARYLRADREASKLPDARSRRLRSRR